MALRRMTCWLLAGFMGLVWGGWSWAASPAEVENALNRAKQWLYSQQNAEGNWEGVPAPTTTGGSDVTGGQWGGLTSIATYALLAAGESPQDPRIVRASQWLREQNVVGIYALGCRANVWNLQSAREQYRDVIRKDAAVLMTALRRQSGRAQGMYHYTPAGQGYDHSASQYGVLGMWALADAGFEVPQDYWRIVDAAWRRNQNKNGSWSYIYRNDESDQRMSMTTAGVATLFITQDFLYTGAETRGNISNPNIDLGLQWVADNWRDTFTSGRIYYTLYGIERIGVASGYKYFGTIDWYKEGARFLVQRQSANGSWGNLPDTCFAILFLSRGRAPVMMNKLQYDIGGREGHWNQRPRDAANIARWVGRQIERDLNWQIVNLKVDADELHDAPILYIAGNQALNFTQEEKDKLKSYLEQGGMILANADAGARAFVDSLRRLGRELFPDYEFRPLPQGHVIYTNQQFPASQWRRRPEVQAMSNGVRELILILPSGDPARSWQLRDTGRNEEVHQLASNIFLYAVDKQNLRTKGETYIVNRDPNIVPTRTIKVARLQYDGNWNPEPGGWRRQDAVMNNSFRVGIETIPVELSKGMIPDQVKIAHLTGTGAFKFNEAQRTQIKDFIDGGGTLIIDAAGGSSEFNLAIQTELSAMFPDHAASLETLLRPDHPIYAAAGRRLDRVGYRMFTRTILPTSELRTPRLRGIEMDGRLAVVYSQEDLSAGMVGQPVDGIVGYDPATATALMSHVLMYAADTKPSAPQVAP